MKPGQDAAELRQGAKRLGLVLEGERLQRLLAYGALLRERAVPQGLVSEGDAGRISGRHLVDCLRAAALLAPSDHLALDLGSGAGLPGIVVAIAVPSVHVRLVESKRRRAAFLELALDRLALTNASVVPDRAEDLDMAAEVAMARALAPLERSWELARPLLRPGGRLLYFSGPLAAPPPVPSGASGVALAAERTVDSSGPVVIITRQ